MGPKNHPIEKENHLPNLRFGVPCSFVGQKSSPHPNLDLFLRWKVSCCLQDRSNVLQDGPRADRQIGNSGYFTRITGVLGPNL